MAGAAAGQVQAGRNGLLMFSASGYLLAWEGGVGEWEDACARALGPDPLPSS